MTFIINGVNGQACCCSEDSEIEIPGGDFEVAPPPAPGAWIDYGTGAFLGPWEVVSGSVSHHDDGHNNLGDGNPNPSTAHLDLNGSTVGAVCQDISGFTIGAEYEIEFFYAIHNAISSAAAILQIDGGNALDISWTATNQGQVSWEDDSYIFIATAETMSFCFYSDSFVSCCGMLIDDISLFCTADMEDPELLLMPPDESYSCIDDVPNEVVVAIDDCTLDVEINLVESFSTNNDCILIITRTWTAEDDCGNSTEHTQLITIIEDQPPEIIIGLEDLFLHCDEDIEFLFDEWIDNSAGAEVIDNCGEVFVDVNYGNFDFESCGVLEVEFIFTDNCFNQTIEFVYFEIYDNDPPIFDPLPMDITVACDQDAEVVVMDWLQQNGFSQIDDNCSYEVDHDFNGDFSNSQTVNFTAINLCGLEASASADIIIDTSLTIVLIDTFTCNSAEAGIVEVLIDNDFCDSLFRFDYKLLPKDTSVFEVTTCSQSEVSIDTSFLINRFNCDSLVIVNTTLALADTIYNELATCDVSLVNRDTLFLTNANNCDSLVIVNTIFEPSDTLYSTIETCDISEVSLDTFFYLNTKNCDSLVIVNTNYVTGDTLYNESTTCDMDLVSLDTLFLFNASNCDSLVITTIYFAQNDTVFVTEYSCDISEPEYTVTAIPGPICDTIVVSEVLPLESDMTMLDFSSCEPSEAGVFIETYTNLTGCDSVVITNVELIIIDTNYVYSETCLLSELVQDTIVMNASGCDSVVVYSTILLPGNQINFEELTCDSLAPINDTMFFQNISGCDSLIITDYTYSPIAFELILDYNPCVDEQSANLEVINLNSNSSPLVFSIDGISFVEETIFMELSEGLYTIVAMDVNGCISGAKEILFQSAQSININLPNLLSLEQGESYQLFLEFSNVPQSFFWSDPNLLTCTNCLDPFVTVDESTSLVLYYLDEWGCENNHEITIEVSDDGVVYITNIFSPNGDGMNDVFQFFANDLDFEMASCEIYDRWGNRVFKNSSKDMVQLFWDGTFMGENVNPGVYIYQITLFDKVGGHVSYTGDVTIVR